MAVSGNLMRANERRSRKPKRKAPDYPAARLVNSLAGRVILVLLAGLAAALGFALLLRQGTALPGSVLYWTVAALLGVATGLAARALLADRTAALRMWAALLALLAELVAMGLMTGGWVGAVLPEAAQAEVNWSWLAQFALGAALAWLTLHAFPVTAPVKSKARKRSATHRTSPTASRRAATKKPAADPASARSKRKPASRTDRRAPGIAAQSARPDSAGQPASARRGTAVQTTAERPSLAQPVRPPAGAVNAAPAARPAAGRAGSSARRSPVIHPRPPARSETPPATRTLWTGPAPSPGPSASTQPAPDLAQLWQGVNRRVQTWRRGALRPAAERDDAGPSQGARTVQPRRANRTSAGGGPAARPSVPVDEQPTEAGPRRSAMERLRSAGQALPVWQALRQRLRPAPRRLQTAQKDPAAERLSPVRLLGEEEHRCPFCLELVEPDDTRGMVECPICHTRHHADCWAVTGACQVPHYHG